jgi:Tfp pilus assembly pilus retraction ATPase PilT
MPEFQIDRFYETFLATQATEGWLLAGQPPLVRIDGRLREVRVPVLSTENVESTMRLICGSPVLESYQKYGRVEFRSPYGDVLEFQVTMIRNGKSCLGLFRPIAKPNNFGKRRTRRPARRPV